MTDSRSLLPREGEIVLRATLPSRREEYARLLEGPLEWQRLLYFADRERAALPLWREIRTSALAGQSDGAKVLRNMAQVWEFKLLHLERLFCDAAEALERNGIEIVLLKGAAAAATAYGGFTHRPMLDVDILVHEEDAERAWTIAQEVGWRWDSARYPRSSYAHAHHMPPLYDAFGAGCGLEIHTRLWMPDHPFDFSEAELRAGSVPISIDGRRCRAPQTNHQLLHCCIHFAWSHRLRSHGWRAFSDVGAFIDSGGIVWDDFVALARRTRADTCCYWTLRLAARVTGAAVPPWVLEALAPAGPRYLLDALERHFQLNLLPDEANTPSIKLARRMWRLGIRRGRGSEGIDLPDDPVPMRLGERIIHHSRQVPLWLSYFRRLM